MPFSSILSLIIAAGLLVIGLIIAFYFVVALLIIGGFVWLYLFIRSRFMRPSFPQSNRAFSEAFKEMVAKETLHDAPIIDGQFETVATKDSPHSDSQKE